MIEKIKVSLRWIKSLAAAVEAFVKTWDDGSPKE
jgi:hypothetical protein